MRTRSPRTILTISAAAALAVAAMAPTAAFAKGPGAGAGDCDGDCTADQPQIQQQAQAGGSGQRIRARDESASGDQVATKASAGGGGQIQARDGSGTQTRQAASSTVQNAGRNANRAATQNGGRNANRAATQNGGLGQNAKDGAGNGPNEDGERGPGTCDECTAEMGDLNDEQLAELRDDLIYMANEEKLAYDVYTYFAGMYDLPIFSNIAKSEARHQEAVNVVLERYDLEDTAIGLEAGEFSNVFMKDTYEQLTAQGSASLDAALEVGVMIEELDITDLKDRLEGLEDVAPDVFEMYSHLLAGSENHLAAFSARAS